MGMIHGIMTRIASCLSAGREPVAETRHLDIWLMPWWLRWLRRYKLCVHGHSTAVAYASDIDELRMEGMRLLDRLTRDLAHEMNSWTCVVHDFDYYAQGDIHQEWTSDDGLLDVSADRCGGMLTAHVRMQCLWIDSGAMHHDGGARDGREMYNCLLLAADGALRDIGAYREALNEVCRIASGM